MEYNLKQEVKRLMDIFEDSFINGNFELILEKRRNLYVNLELVKTVKDLNTNMIQWKTRACIKGDDEKILIKTRKKYNEFFKKDFSLEELELIYELLGNGVNQDLCEKFVDDDLNIEILKNYKGAEVMKAKYSGIDNQGKAYIDCSECKKGGKGDSSCSKVKKPKQGMCFRGELLDKFEAIK